MEMFPEDITIDIFSRLPVKSIGQFRCVSKAMNRLLSQPHFIKTHLNQSKLHFPNEEETQTLIIVSYNSYNLYSTQLRVDAHQVFEEMSTFATNLSVDDMRLLSITKVKNVACCDGLILVWDDSNKLLLFNHTTKELHQLITPSSYALANYFTNGLGYDSFSDDYKVVTVSYCNVDHDNVNYDEMFVDVYSVKNGTWKRVENNCTNCHALNSFDSGVFVNGRIHWRATRIISDDGSSESVIVAFDLKEEKFDEIVFPSWIGSMRYEGCHIVSLGGCLGMYPDIVAVLSYGGVDPIEIWIMKEYGVMESWTKYEMCRAGSSNYRTKCLLGNNQVVLEKHDGLGQRGVHKLVLYDLNQRTCKDIVVGGITDEFFVGGTSMASLVSPYPSNIIGDVTKELRRMNLVPKEPSPSSLHRLISSVVDFNTFGVCVCILVLGVFVAAIVKWRVA